MGRKLLRKDSKIRANTANVKEALINSPKRNLAVLDAGCVSVYIFAL
jgi:hypothetical protein